jgi:hypothetical protein
MAGPYFGSNADERLGQILEAELVHVLLHALVETHAAEQSVAADLKIHQSEDAPLCQAAGEGFKFVELAGQITAADESADRGAGDHVDLDAGLVQRPQHADSPVPYPR